MLRVLHTSDVQLGAPFRFLGNKGARHREQLRQTFGHVVDLAMQARFDLLLIAGDLFNDSRPHQGTADFVASQLARATIPVCILPGNHDCYGDASVYRTGHFPENVRILTGQPSALEFPDLDVTVYGNAIMSRQSRTSPMQGLMPGTTTSWHIAMAHGNLVRADVPDPVRPIRPEELRACGMDYVALGDWHAFADYSHGQVRAFYSGAPEPTALGQRGAGFVACVELGAEGVSVRRERVGRVTTDELLLDVSGRSRLGILDEIRTRADRNLMMRVALFGLTDLGTALDARELEEELAADFYYVECDDRSHPQLASIPSGDFPQELVVGKFVRLMQAKIENAASAAQRRQAEQALQLGIALMQGRRVL